MKPFSKIISPVLVINLKCKAMQTLNKKPDAWKRTNPSNPSIHNQSSIFPSSNFHQHLPTHPLLISSDQRFVRQNIVNGRASIRAAHLDTCWTSGWRGMDAWKRVESASPWISCRRNARSTSPLWRNRPAPVEGRVSSGSLSSTNWALATRTSSLTLKSNTPVLRVGVSILKCWESVSVGVNRCKISVYLMLEGKVIIIWCFIFIHGGCRNWFNFQLLLVVKSCA